MERSAELEETFRGYIGAIASGDAAAIEGLMAEGVLLVGTDPAEWWRGKTTAVEVFRKQMAEMGGGFPVEAVEPEAYVSGDMGWAADRPKLSLPEGEMRLRLTTVFVRQSGDWKIIQSHASIGIANEDALGQELTI